MGAQDRMGRRGRLRIGVVAASDLDHDGAGRSPGS